MGEDECLFLSYGDLSQDIKHQSNLGTFLGGLADRERRPLLGIEQARVLIKFPESIERGERPARAKFPCNDPLELVLHWSHRQAQHVEMLRWQVTECFFLLPS